MATVKHVSYAGITLPLASPQLIRIVEGLRPWDVFTEADFWNFNQPVQQTSRLPAPSLPTLPKFRIGTLSWPTGASRPAWFHAVVETARLEAIRDVVGNPEVPQPLVMYDGRVGHEVTASMYMLPARPLNQLGHDLSDSWLLTLTDARFFWYFKRATVATKPSSWASLYATLGTALGVTIGVGSVDPAYKTPSSKWVGYYLPTPAVLDAAATTVGQRIVVQLDGTVSAVNWENARDDSDALVGDDELRVLIGGVVTPSDVQRYVPESVKTLFFDSSASDTTVPHVEDQPLSGLSVPGYGASTGITGNTQVVYADLVYDGTNGGDVTAYAEAASTDWYGWRLADVDLSLPGIWNWVPTGWEDAVEWTVDLRDRTVPEVELESPGDGIPDPFSSTVIRRGPWSDVPSGYFPVGNDVVPPNPSGCDGTGWGWVAGLLHLPDADPPFSECLKLTVLSADGFCGAIDTGQVLYLRTEDGVTWTSQKWDCTGGPPPTGWVDEDFLCDDPTGPAVFTPDTSATTSVPRLMICGVSYSLTIVCGGQGVVVFEGGGTNYCNGTPPTEACQRNTFQVKLECVCCSIDGWQGPGYYCVCADTDDCDTCEKACVLLTDENRCDDTIVICSCKFDTLEDCEGFCGAPPPVGDAECLGTPVTVSTNLYLHFGTPSPCTGDLAFLNGQTIGPMVWDGAGSWVNVSPQLGFTLFKVELNPGPPWEICSTGVILAGCVDDSTGLSCNDCTPYNLENAKSIDVGSGTCVTNPGAGISYRVDESPT